MENIVQAATSNGSFKTLLTAVKAAGLSDTLSGIGPFTVFAPTDEAFAKLPKGTVENLLKDKIKLKEILTYHVVPGKVLARDVAKLSTTKTLQGKSLHFDNSNGVKIGNATVIKSDILTSNGVIHVIDSVMLPN